MGTNRGGRLKEERKRKRGSVERGRIKRWKSSGTNEKEGANKGNEEERKRLHEEWNKAGRKPKHFLFPPQHLNIHTLAHTGTPFLSLNRQIHFTVNQEPLSDTLKN